MIRITFNNVGQGDTIFLEWGEQFSKIGIIDCRKYNGRNPAIDFLKFKKLNEISFLFLSHPHLDHCSGFADLIDFCIDQNIRINYFLHTSNNTPSFWRAAIVGKEEDKEILKLFYKIREASEKCSMSCHPLQANMITGDISLGDEYSIKIIAPTSSHLDSYARNFMNTPNEEEVGNNPSANWLATVLKIYSNKYNTYILLTSDAFSDTMHYDKYSPNDFIGKLVLAQCPHHGARNNYKNAFWRLIDRNQDTPIVISVGNNNYGHPADFVVSNLTKNNYKIFSTNLVGGLLKSSVSPLVIETIVHLKTFGDLVTLEGNNQYMGNKTFEINTNGSVTFLS